MDMCNSNPLHPNNSPISCATTHGLEVDPSVVVAQPASPAPMTGAKSPPPSLIYSLPSYVRPVDYCALFPSQQPVEIELGAGDGGFLVTYAQAHPEINLIGVERLLGRLRKIDRKGQRAHLTNLRLIRLEANYWVRYLLPAGSVRAFHIYFPDPWPKRRHQDRRLINASFCQAAMRALASNGCLYLRTDDASYFEQMQTVCSAQPGLRCIETPADLTALMTKFEKGFVAAGQPIHRVAYQRIDPGSA